MSYNAQINRSQPILFIFLIDQSWSMSKPIVDEAAIPKADIVTDALNKLLDELTVRCNSEEGIRDYIYVSVIGYGGDRATSALQGALERYDYAPISKIDQHPIRVDKRTQMKSDGAGGVVPQTVDFPVWVESAANGSTPMCDALGMARKLAQAWTRDYPDGYPPIVLNLTDGEARDGDPLVPAQELRAIGTSDGATLLFNLHISSAARIQIMYPSTDASLPDMYSKQLFQMSSMLPPTMTSFAKEQGYACDAESRGFVYNADVASIVYFLSIGTRPGLPAPQYD